MAKIGTVQVEVNPVLGEKALQSLGDQIETTVRAAVQRALNVASPATPKRPVLTADRTKAAELRGEQ